MWNIPDNRENAIFSFFQSLSEGRLLRVAQLPGAVYGTGQLNNPIYSWARGETYRRLRKVSNGSFPEILPAQLIWTPLSSNVSRKRVGGRKGQRQKMILYGFFSRMIVDEKFDLYH